MDITFAAATDIGRARKRNEDNFLIDGEMRLFVVCDGMGGHAGGDVASALAVHTIRDSIATHLESIRAYRAGSETVTAGHLLDILDAAIQDACAAIFAQAEKEPARRGMGTTASILLLAGDADSPRGFIAHVGDSRVYLLRHGQSHQLTEDHSLVNELLRSGRLRRGELETSPFRQFKNAVTRAVGVTESVAVDTVDFDVLPGDSFVLCSDGLHGYLEAGDLATKVSSLRVEEVPAALVQHANDAGGSDNITAVVVRVTHDQVTEEMPLIVEQWATRIDTLKGMPLFRYLSYRQLVQVANVSSLMEVGPGDVIFEEQTAGSSMFIVLGGRVALRKNDVVLAELGPGDHFGEMCLIDHAPRSTAAVAKERTQLAVIARSEFHNLLKTEPELSVKLLWSLMQVLALRLRKTTNHLHDALEDRPLVETEDELRFSEP
ncbi:MAG: cyclic nucleotide-binding domain-containing protein [Myxococcales bacterium]|nr:cyclic nucleotide-binding domain-containing protein [Myxococcales bacterium]